MLSRNKMYRHVVSPLLLELVLLGELIYECISAHYKSELLALCTVQAFTIFIYRYGTARAHARATILKIAQQ